MSKNKKLDQTLRNNTYEVISMATLFNKDEKVSVGQLSKSLNLAIKNLSQLQSYFPESEIVINAEDINGEIIRPFQSGLLMNTKGQILAKDLELICKFPDMFKVELRKSNTQQSLSFLSAEASDQERLENAKIKAVSLLQLIKNDNPNASELNMHLKDEEDAGLIRSMLDLGMKGANLELIVHDTNVPIPTANQAPFKLMKSEFMLKSVIVSDISPKREVLFIADSINSNVLIENNILTNKIIATFHGDKNELKLLKFLEVSKLKFDVDIQSFEKIYDRSLDFSLIKIHISQSLKDRLFENLLGLFEVLEENK